MKDNYGTRKPIETILEENEIKILEVLEIISEASENGLIIIVEGKRDKKALESLGIHGKIIILNERNKRLVDQAEKILNECISKEILILFDFDREGVRLYKELKLYLNGANIKVREDLRLKLKHTMKDIRCIEELIRIRRKIYEWEE